MKVTLRTLAAGPEWVAQPGETIDLPEAQARELVEHGYATPVDPLPLVAETATVPNTAEVAALKAKAKRG